MPQGAAVSRMHPLTRQALAAIQAAGPQGILREDLKAKITVDSVLSKRLDNLIFHGYVIKQGKHNKARFIATGKVPSDATAADAEAAIDGGDPEAAMRADALRKTPKGVPPGVPNSVFALGAVLNGATTSAAAAEAAGAALLAEPAPAPKRELGTTAAFPWNQPPKLDIPTLGQLPGHLVPRKPAAEPEGVLPKPPTPRFELHSDGVLVIDPAGDGIEPIALPPTLTRQFFRWLDRIGGLQLSQLLEDEAPAEAGASAGAAS